MSIGAVADDLEIPKSVTLLHYNPLTLKAVIPSSVTTVVFGDRFNARIMPDMLPKAATDLVLGVVHNAPIEPGDIPDTVTGLTLGYSFNHGIQVGSLPSRLVHLMLGDSFDHPITVGMLPNTLKQLTLGRNYTQPLIANALPSGLTHLELGSNCHPIEPGVLPHSLTNLKLDNREELQPGSLPPNLIQLDLGFGYNYPLIPSVIPSHVTHLTFGDSYDQPLVQGALPSSITHLYFGTHYKSPITANAIPSSVTHLVFGLHFNQPLHPGDLPASIQHLSFGRMYNQPIEPGTLIAVTHLVFGEDYNQEFASDSLPTTLESLSLESKFNHPLTNCPPSLCHIKIGILSLSMFLLFDNEPFHHDTAQLSSDAAKTKLSDLLVSHSGVTVSGKTSGGLKSASTPLSYELADSSVLPAGSSSSKFLINLVDTPTYHGLTIDTAAAFKITDGCVVIADVVYGLNDYFTLTHAIVERVKPVLFLNNLDSLLLNNDMTESDMYHKLINRVENQIVLGRHKDVTNRWQRLFWLGQPRRGFTLQTFAKLHAAKLGVSVNELLPYLWEDHYYNATKKQWSKYSSDGDKGFIHFILKPLRQLAKAVMSQDNASITSALETIGVQVPVEDREAFNGKPEELFGFIMGRIQLLSDCILEMVVIHLPSPLVAQKYRSSILYSGPPQDDQTYSAMTTCDPNGPVMMYVSKMVPSTDGQFIAFGRVFSGTLTTGATIRILMANYTPYSPTLNVRTGTIQDIAFMLGSNSETLNEACPSGNIIGLTGVDLQYIAKTATIASSEESYSIESFKFTHSSCPRLYQAQQSL
eukprot:gene11413-13302_t